MDEAHNSTYSIHPGATKMCVDIQDKYWWRGMKGDVVRFVAQCDVCQRVMVEHQKYGHKYGFHQWTPNDPKR
jgi:hypothetical protein